MLIEVKVPVLAESISEALIMTWNKAVGEQVNVDDKLVDIETDKVVLEIVASHAGRLEQVSKQVGELVNSEEIIAVINTEAVGTQAVAAAAAPVAPPVVATPAPAPVVAAPAAPVAAAPAPQTSPAVRKMAEEQNLNVAQVAHQGNRVTKADMLAHASASAMQTVAPAPRPAAAIQPPPAARGRPQERVPMTRLRKRVSERLLGAQQEHAILTTFNEINMKPVMDLRNKYKDLFEKTHNARLGFMSFFVKAAVAALQKFPVVNASTHGDDIVYHGFYDIGIAVSAPRGLVVPILRDADKRSLANIEAAIADFGKRARDNKLELDDLEGGTFSITNGGIFGSMMSTPILNPPQSAILGMHNIVERPVAENGQVVIRPIMYVALSYDHCIIDGREAVQTLVCIKQALEDPARMLLEL